MQPQWDAGACIPLSKTKGVIFCLSSLGAARIRAPYLGSRIWTLQFRASDLQGVTHRCRNNLEITCNSKDSKSLQWVCMSDVSCPLMCDSSQHPKQIASLVLSGLWLLLLIDFHGSDSPLPGACGLPNTLPINSSPAYVSQT